MLGALKNKAIDKRADLTEDEENEVIKKDSRYGKMVCRCEQITEGEIVRAIHENPPARSVSAIKRTPHIKMVF